MPLLILHDYIFAIINIFQTDNAVNKTKQHISLVIFFILQMIHFFNFSWLIPIQVVLTYTIPCVYLFRIAAQNFKFTKSGRLHTIMRNTM